MKSEHYTKLKAILALLLDIPEENITEFSNIDNLEGWDSLRQLNLIVALEEEFNCEISENNITELTSIEKILDYLDKNV